MKNIKISIIGRGPRVHALVCALEKISLVEGIALIPGDGVIHSAGDKIWHVPIRPDRPEALLGHTKSNGIDVVFIFSRELIELGISELFKQMGKEIVDLTQKTIRLEASMVIANEFMQQHRSLFFDFEIIKNPA